MKNTVTLVGFVGNTPEVRETKTSATVTTVSLATSRSFKLARLPPADEHPGRWPTDRARFTAAMTEPRIARKLRKERRSRKIIQGVFKDGNKNGRPCYPRAR